MAGILVKLLSQPVLLRFTGEIGMLYSTILGLVVTILLMLKIMNDRVSYSYKYIWRRTLLISLLSLIMGIFTKISYNLFGLFLNYESRMQALVGMLLVAVVGLIVYGYLALKSRLAEKIIGPKAFDLKRKLGIK